jgi:hypothetical protein
VDYQPARRGVARAARVICITALLAVCCTGAALAAASSQAHVATQAKLGGKWKGHYSGAVTGTFTLRWSQKGRKLTGSIALSNPKGSYAIDGSVRSGGRLKFGAVGVGATYKGTVHGTSMSGTWSSPQGGGSWSAHKAKKKS